MSSINYHKELCHRAGMDTSAVEELEERLKTLVAQREGAKVTNAEKETLENHADWLDDQGGQNKEIASMLREALAEVERLRAAGNALANASMVCPEDLDEQREAWREAIKGER